MLPKLLTCSFLLSAVCLSGCADRTAVPTKARALSADELTHTELAHAPSAPWPEALWWTHYQDPQLNQWMQRALSTSPTLKATQARIRHAYALAGVNLAQQKVLADGGASINAKQWPDDHFYGPGDLARSHSWDNQANVRFSYDLDLWGRLASTQAQANDQVEAAKAQALIARLTLQEQLIDQYVQLDQHHRHTAIAQKQLAHQQQLLALAHERVRLGLGTQLEVSHVEQALPALKRQLDVHHEAIALTQNRLAALAGLPLTEAKALKAPALKVHERFGLPSQLPLELLAKRPDIQLALRQVSAASHGIAVRKADFYPNINVAAQVANLATQGSLLSFLTQRKTSLSVGPALSLPLFDGGRLGNALSAANAEYDMAVEGYNQLLHSALAQITEQLLRWHSLSEQAEFVHEALSIASRNLKLAELRYAKGLSDYQSVLHAEAQVFIQEHLHAQIRSQQLSTQAHLQVALGGAEPLSHALPPLTETAR